MREREGLISNQICNLCSFRCPKCYVEYKNLVALQKKCLNTKCHIFSELKLYKYFTKVVTHKCKICSRLLLNDIRCIIQHARNHGMRGAKEYANSTGCTLLKSEREFAERVVASEVKISKNIGNFCTYECKKCSHATRSWCMMRQHLTNMGHGNASKEHQPWRSLIKEIVMHICFICQEKIVNDKQLLRSHLKERHNETIQQYTKKYHLVSVRSKAKSLIIS